MRDGTRDSTHGPDRPHAVRRAAGDFGSLALVLWRGDGDGRVFDVTGGLAREGPRVLADLMDVDDAEAVLAALREHGRVEQAAVRLRQAGGRSAPARCEASVVGTIGLDPAVPGAGAGAGGWLVEGAIVPEPDAAAEAQRWRRLAEDAPAGLLAAALPGGEIEWANAEAAAVLGGFTGPSAAELIGRSMRRHLRPGGWEEVARASADGSLLAEAELPDGRHLRLAGRTILDAAGVARRLMLSLTDVSLTHAAGQRRARRLSAVAAELTTLPGVAARIGADLTTYERARRGGLKVEAERVDLCGPVIAAVDDYAAFAAERGLTLGEDCSNAGLVRGDPALLRQAVGGLIRHALRHADAGVVAVADTRGDRSRVRVRRTGGPAAVAADDVGLGLARKVAGLHGGSISTSTYAMTLALPRLTDFT